MCVCVCVCVRVCVCVCVRVCVCVNGLLVLVQLRIFNLEVIERTLESQQALIDGWSEPHHSLVA